MTVFRVGLVALLVVALAEYAPQVRSEEQEQSEGTDDTEDDVYQQPSHLLTDLPEAADDVSTTYVFPDHPNLMITSGESVEVSMTIRRNRALGDCNFGVANLLQLDT